MTCGFLESFNEFTKLQLGALLVQCTTVECQRMAMPSGFGDLVNICSLSPPWQLFDPNIVQPRFSHRTHPSQVIPRGISIILEAETSKNRGAINQHWLTQTDDFPVAAVWMLGGIGNDTGSDRIEMHIGYNLPEVVLVHMNPMEEAVIAAETAGVAGRLGASIKVGYEGMEIHL